MLFNLFCNLLRILIVDLRVSFIVQLYNLYNQTILTVGFKIISYYFEYFPGSFVINAVEFIQHEKNRVSNV